jgi:hypothetical protein
VQIEIPDDLVREAAGVCSAYIHRAQQIVANSETLSGVVPERIMRDRAVQYARDVMVFKALHAILEKALIEMQRARDATND